MTVGNDPEAVVDALDADRANNNHLIGGAFLADSSVLLKMAADAAVGSDTCPSPEIADSRKRPLEGDTENGVSKRSHYSTTTTTNPNNNNNSTIMNSTTNAVGKFHLNPPVNEIPSPRPHPPPNRMINQRLSLIDVDLVGTHPPTLYPTNRIARLCLVFHRATPPTDPLKTFCITSPILPFCYNEDSTSSSKTLS